MMKGAPFASVVAAEWVAEGTIQIDFERPPWAFRAGQEIVVHGAEPCDDRTYSIASGEHDQLIRILVRVVPGGRISPRLALLRPGDTVRMSGPQGSFIIPDVSRQAMLIATGTGIAPFRSFLRTYTDWQPILLHGVRSAADLYWRPELEPLCRRYVPCVSRQGEQLRRVTDWLATEELPEGADYYLCGKYDMIRDAVAVLSRRGVSPANIRTEIFYYW